MATPDKLVVFNLDDRRFAMPLSAVVRVERIVAITPLPKTPEIVLGVVKMWRWMGDGEAYGGY